MRRLPDAPSTDALPPDARPTDEPGGFGFRMPPSARPMMPAPVPLASLPPIARRAGFPSALAALAALAGADGVAAQQGGDGPVGRLAEACIEAVPGGGDSRDRTSACTRGALGAHAVQGALGLLMGAGGAFPASPSTAGQRLQGSPRWVVDVGTGVVRTGLPSRTDVGVDAREERVLMAPRLSVGAGVFDGFSPSPTVGGVGSLDLVGELRFLPVPRLGVGSDRVMSWGLGARIGVFRESFTLPGVTLVAMHRRAGTVDFVNPDGGPGLPEQPNTRSGMRVSPNVTSFRAVAGKDLMEIGVTAGVQRDRIRGDVEIRSWDRFEGSLPLPLPPPEAPRSGSRALPVDRTTWFLGLNRTWVVTQVTAEFGWSPEPPARGGDAGPDGWAGAGPGFSGALSFRITY